MNRANELGSHIIDATHTGVSNAERAEVILQMSTYGGMPVCIEGITIARQAFEKSAGLDARFTGNRSGSWDGSPEALFSYLLADGLRRVDGSVLLVYGLEKGVIAVSYISQGETGKDSGVDSKVLFEPE